jgi:hypothetical protein
MLVDTLGLLLAVYVTLADLHDQRGARCLLAGLTPVLPRLKKLWADVVNPRTGVGCLVPAPRVALLSKWLSAFQARVASASCPVALVVERTRSLDFPS